jgi:acyl-CoA reductase-like NAD-dependent aldehyde dehydrogenase
MMFDVINPVTGIKIASYPLMDASEVGTLVQTARRHFAHWAEVPIKEKMKILAHAAEILADNALHYAQLIADENGKNRFDALMADVYPTCDIMHYYARNAEKFLTPVKARGSIMMPGRRLYYRFEPRGVVAIVSPWNYPLCLSAGPVVSAIAAGNTVVLKPSSYTTGSSMVVREILEKAGLPEGIVNVATGRGSLTGQAPINNTGIDMYFFTGSSEIGRMINIEAAGRLVPAVMELSGKDAVIVTKNADLDRAAHAVAWGAFTNSGQTCIGIELCLVERDIYDRFLQKLMAIVSQIKCGRDAGQMGSMTLESQYNIVEQHVADALQKGAVLQPPDVREFKKKGMYYPPVVLTGITENMKLMSEETFGPLLPVIPYDSEDEAVRIANGTVFGLSGSVFTRDMDEGRRIAGRLKTGSVNINDSLMTFASPALPFGGIKESGIGVYHSEQGLRAFTNIKSIIENGNMAKKEFFHYPLMPGSEKGMAEAIRFLFSRSISQKIKVVFKVLPFMQKMRREGKMPAG